MTGRVARPRRLRGALIAGLAGIAACSGLWYAAAAAPRKSAPQPKAPAEPAGPPRPADPVAPATPPPYDCGATKKSGLLHSIGVWSGSYAVDGKKGIFVCQSANTLPAIGAPRTQAASLNFTAMNRIEFQDRQLDMPESTRKLQAIVDHLAAYWPYTRPENVRVRIVGAGDFQAEALADNSIKVHLGLLTGAQSEDEIAFVLAHEYAHIALGHLKRNDYVQGQNRMISTLSDAYYYGVKLSQQQFVQAGTTATLETKDAGKVVAAQQEAQDSSQRLHLVLDIIVTPAWKRQQEDEADALGYDLATRAGYDTSTGASQAFATLSAAADAQRTLVDQLSKNTDDSLKQASDLQAQALATQIKAAPATAGSAQVPNFGLDAFWSTLNAKVREATIKTFHDVFSRTHRRAEERMDGLNHYETDAYGSRDLPEPPPWGGWLDWIRSKKEYKDAEKAVAAVDASGDARIAGDVPKARETINKALATGYAATPMVLNETARVLSAEGQKAKADELFTRADAQDGQSVIAFQDHVDLLIDLRNWEKASATIDKAASRVNDRKPFWPQTVRIGFALHKDDDAIKTLHDCIGFENADLKLQCVNNAPFPDTPDFARLSKDNQAAVLDARSKVNDKSMIDKARNLVGGLTRGFSSDAL
ncbi:MAG: M48 family metalloprotease [Asticcacaulis sp.]|nr:M48 family metalloprotease [Asticcacaulis sp.]